MHTCRGCRGLPAHAAHAAAAVCGCYRSWHTNKGLVEAPVPPACPPVCTVICFLLSTQHCACFMCDNTVNIISGTLTTLSSGFSSADMMDQGHCILMYGITCDCNLCTKAFLGSRHHPQWLAVRYTCMPVPRRCSGMQLIATCCAGATRHAQKPLLRFHVGQHQAAPSLQMGCQFRLTAAGTTGLTMPLTTRQAGKQPVPCPLQCCTLMCNRVHGHC